MIEHFVPGTDRLCPFYAFNRDDCRTCICDTCGFVLKYSFLQRILCRLGII